MRNCQISADSEPGEEQNTFCLLFCSGPAPADGPWSLARPDLGSFWAQPKITANIAAPEHFGSCWGQNRPKIDQKWQGGMSLVPGHAFFRERQKNYATPEAHGLLAWFALACQGQPSKPSQRFPKIDAFQNMVLGLMEPHMAQNGTLTGDWESRRRRERRPKADLLRVDALGAFRRPGHRPAGGRRPT